MAVFTLTAGVDNFTGIAGQDNTFQFTPLTLQSTDTVTGGATGVFIDILSLTAAGTITAAQFAGVTNVERLDLPDGGNTVIADQRSGRGIEPGVGVLHRHRGLGRRHHRRQRDHQRQAARRYCLRAAAICSRAGPSMMFSMAAPTTTRWKAATATTPSLAGPASTA